MMSTTWENLWILGSPHISQPPFSILLGASVSAACYGQPFVWQVSEEPAPSGDLSTIICYWCSGLRASSFYVCSFSPRAHCYSVGWVTTTPEEDALCPYKVFFEIMPKTPTNWLARDLWNLVFIQWFLNHYYSGIQISLTLSSGVSSGCCLLSLDITQQF